MLGTAPFGVRELSKHHFNPFSDLALPIVDRAFDAHPSRRFEHAILRHGGLGGCGFSGHLQHPSEIRARFESTDPHKAVITSDYWIRGKPVRSTDLLDRHMHSNRAGPERGAEVHGTAPDRPNALDTAANRVAFWRRTVVEVDVLVGTVAKGLVVRGTTPAQREGLVRRRDHVPVLVLEHDLAFDER